MVEARATLNSQQLVNYLSETYGGKYTIKQCDFQQYDYGITGGQFLYDFSIEDQNGQKYTAHYGRLTDLSKDTVEYIRFEFSQRGL